MLEGAKSLGSKEQRLIRHDVADRLFCLVDHHSGFRRAGRIRDTAGMDGRVVGGVPVHRMQADYFHLGSTDLGAGEYGETNRSSALQTQTDAMQGVSVGPALSNGLKTYFGAENVATQGVNYLALIETNFYPGGAPPYGIYEMQVLLATAAIYCPQSKIVAAGYSQGAAITHRAVESLPQYVKDRIAGIVTFGDTQAYQDGGRIKGYPLEKTFIICNTGDLVCIGTAYIAPTHFPEYYLLRVPEAVSFLVGRLLLTP